MSASTADSASPIRPMQIVVVGAGNVGHALGTGALRVGHHVTYAVRANSDRSLPDGAVSTGVAGAADGADLTILAVPFGAAADALAELAPPDGAVVVDATNPFGSPVPEGKASGAAYLAAITPQARLVKAFNVLGAEHMANPQLPDGSRPVLPVASDSAEARAEVARLASQLGFDAVEVGGLEAAGVIEEAARYWGLLAMAGGRGRQVVLVAHQRQA